MAILRRAVAGGYRDIDLIRVESGLRLARPPATTSGS